MTEKHIKIEEFQNEVDFGDHLAENLSENPESQRKPWCPSSKGRSIVWEHITWDSQSQKAACNYCPAEFQIKGGTSALLRHLKTNHPIAIKFDPENAPPVRRKKKKLDDYTVVTEDTKSYMDNLLQQFLQDDTAPRQEAGPSSQTRADSEIDEVIRNLEKESAKNGAEESDSDQDLRKLLGMDDERSEEIVTMAPPTSGPNDEEKQVSSTQNSSAKKRKIAEDAPKSGAPAGDFHPSPARFPLGPPPPPPPVVSPMKISSNAVSVLDFEAKVLYNQSLHSTIAREDAMTTYYRMKARKMELEIKKLEKELGEDEE